MVLVRTSVSIGLLTVFTAGLANWPREAAADTCVFQQGLDGYSGTVDTFLKESSPGSSYGSSDVVEWDGEDADGENIGLLRFDNIFGSGTGQVPLGVIITSATLTYDVVNSGNSGSANEVLVSWDESVTYNTFGGDAGVQTDEYGSLVGTAAGGSGSRSLDVKSSIVDWALDPSANKGWIFRPTGGNDGVEFRSSENTSSSLRPKLTVNYDVPTGAEIMPDHIDAVVGNVDVEVVVYIPPGSNDNDDVHVTLTTDNGAVALPVGATGEPPVRTLDFPQGEPTYQIASIDIGIAGSATITTANDAALSDDTLTVSVTAGAATFTPTSLDVTEGTTRPIKVSLSPGSNDTREVVVTLWTDNTAVAVPAGASGDHLDLPFTEGGPAEQMVDIEIGVAGQASITTTNNGGLADADPLPVTVTSGFRFTVSCDPRNEIELWEGLLATIKTNLGGPGAFHVSCGDIDPIQPVRDSIDTWLGPTTLWYPGIGNHEEETTDDMDWLRDEYNNGNDGDRTPLKDFTNEDGPASTIETTYSWDYGNARFIMLNEYWDGTSDIGTDGDIVPELYDWLEANLAANTQPVIFVFGHEPAFPFYRHVGDSLDKEEYKDNRDAFWSLLGDEGVQAYFCGHTHVYSKHQEPANETWQIDVGNAGNTSAGFPDGQTFADVTVTDTQVRYDIWRNVTGSWERQEQWTVPVGLKIRLDPSQIQRTVNQGEDLTNDTFTVRSIGPGTLNYTITDDVDWLSLSPDYGSSEGEEDTIQVIYDVDGLSPGMYPATISVGSGDAINSPQTIDVTVTVQGPTIVLGDSVINRTVFVGDDLPKDSFTVANGGPAMLNYTIQDDAPWLAVDPEAGESTGEEDTIEVIYTVSALPAQVDPHTATIQVFSGDAGNSPQTLTVNVTVETVSPDFDFDADVDLEDFGQFQVCFSGSVAQYDPACFKARLDGDLDVDGDDLAIFQACLSGANIPAEPTCDD